MANSIARLAVHFAADATGLKAGIAQVNSQLATVGKGVVGNSPTAGGAGSGILGMLGMSGTTAAAIVGVGAALAAMTGYAVAAAAQMQTLTIQFEVLTGSASAAKGMLDELRTLAADTPLGLQEVSQAAKILLAMGEDKGGVVAQVEMLGDVAAISGKPLNELAIIYGQVMQAGRLTSQELLQFNNANVPLLQKLSQMTGVSTAQVRKMIEEGKIGADLVVQAFREMTSAGGLMAGGMSRSLETLSGQWGKLYDRITMLGADLLKGPTQALTLLLSGVNQALDLLGGSNGADATAERKKQLDVVQKNKEAETRRAEAEKEAAKLREESDKAAKEMRKRADSIAQSLREPSEVFADTLAELKGLQEQGLLDWDTYVKGVTKAMGDLRAAEERSSPKLKAPQPSQGVGAVVQGTTAAFSAIQQAARDSQAQLDYQRQLIEIEKREQATLDKILAAANAQKPVRVKQVNL